MPSPSHPPHQPHYARPAGPRSRPSTRTRTGLWTDALLGAVFAVALSACGGDTTSTDTSTTSSTATASTSTADTTAATTSTTDTSTAVLSKTFGTQINTSQWANYSGQTIPAYIVKRNAGGVDNARATLGRVLFYDKNLSIENTVSCASCHQHAIGFTDAALASQGVAGGLTGRHSMRLINTRFADENRFFWDKRAASLEEQTLQPIQDHNEMGFSGQAGRPTLTDLIAKLNGLDYYPALFQKVYGDTSITPARMQESLAPLCAQHCVV